jgi:hypothetical protein
MQLFQPTGTTAGMSSSTRALGEGPTRSCRMRLDATRALDQRDWYTLLLATQKKLNSYTKVGCIQAHIECREF